MRGWFELAGSPKRIAAIALAFATVSSVVSAAELKGYAEPCPEKKEICFWHKAVVKPPKGWIEDKEWTRRYKALVLFAGADKSSDKPFMYVRTHAGDQNLGIDDYVRVAQERWTQHLRDSAIEPLPDVVRNGKPTFKVYFYKNPSQPDQAFELTAFMKDVDASHPEHTYFFQVVLAAPTMNELEKAKPAFFELLERL